MEKIYVSNEALKAHLNGDAALVATGCDCVITVLTSDECAHEVCDECEYCGKEPQMVQVPDLDSLHLKGNGILYEAV